jgi:hypothetical protein
MNVMDSIVSKLDQRISSLEEIVKSYSIQTENERKLLNQLNMERFKNRIYYQIIKNNTTIRIEDILTEETILNSSINDTLNMSIHESHVIQNIDSIPTILPDNSTSNIQQSIQTDEQSSVQTIVQKKKTSTSKETSGQRPRKKVYRSIKMSEEQLKSEPSAEELAQHIKTIDDSIKEKLDEFSDVETVYKDIKVQFELLKTSRIYTKILEEIKSLRSSIFGRMNISDYKNLVLEHTRIMEGIFHDKNYTDKKSRTIISKSLSSLESRLISYTDYATQHIEIDEVEKLGIVLDLYSQIDKDYVCYNKKYVSELFYNYGTVLFPLQANLERYLFNRYGFKNIVYLPYSKSTDTDPYSFYVLENYRDRKRYWKMDCRLEELTQNLIETIMPYMISMFRKIYRDVFSDNNFRSNFLSFCQVTECDCEQLLQNITLMAYPRKFQKLIQNIVKKNSSIIVTESDKFNMYSDDVLQRRRFHEKEDIDFLEIMKQLFDGVSSDEAVDFYRARGINQA